MATFTFAPSAAKVEKPKTASVEYDMRVGEAEVTVSNGNGGYATLPPASVVYLVTYGLKQSLADSFASAKTQDEFDGMLSKRIKKLMEGTMSFREGTGPVDPFESECIRIATAKLRAAAKTAGKTLPKATEPKFKELVAAIRNGKRKDEIEKEARRRLKETEAVDVADDIDLSGL